MTKNNNLQNQLLRRIETGSIDGLPDFDGFEHVSSVADWRIYISRDPCHDDESGSRPDRNTVIALHQQNGTWRIIGRELPRKFALQIANGEV